MSTVATGPGEHITVVVEREGDSKFEIKTTDLERVSSQLRKQRHFSLFSLCITIATVIVTSLVGQVAQYISWHNTATMDRASDLITRADAAYQRAAEIVTKRHYATQTYLDAMNGLAGLQNVEGHLQDFKLELSKTRFKNFYEGLKLWNESYDRLIGEIDFSLDRPVGIRLIAHRSDISGKLHCDAYSMLDEMDRLKLNRDSLKTQLFIINFCFDESVSSLVKATDAAVNDKAMVTAVSTREATQTGNDSVLSFYNEFRCYALSRIQLFKDYRVGAIFAPFWEVWPTLIYNQRDGLPAEASRHFAEGKRFCSSVMSAKDPVLLTAQ